MATASAQLDDSRLLNRQKRDKRKKQVSRSSIAEPRALGQARDLRYSPKNRNIFKRMLRRRGSVVKAKAEKLGINPLHLVTARVLQISWIAFFAGIFSFGITSLFALLYLHTHLMGRLIMPQVFAKFGTEWMPLKGRAIHTPSRFLGVFEIAGILFIDVIVIGVTLIATTFLVLLIQWVSDNPVTSFILYDALPVLKKYIPFL